MPFSVNSFSIGEYQDCRRKYALSREWWLRRWRPRSLFDACLRKGIFQLSKGDDLKHTIDRAQFDFMTMASNPGLETAYDPYRMSKDYCSILSTSLTYLSKIILLKLHYPAVVPLNSTTEWEFSCFADDSGQLHRWVIVSDWSDSDLPGEMHNWRTMGDLVVSRCPMMLHIFSVGRVVGGRPTTPWCRGYRHPAMPGLRTRFKRTTGKEFDGWHTVWLSEISHSAEEWVDLMIRDKVTDELVRHITVNVPSDTICEDVIKQITSEAMAMKEIGDWRDMPMSRNSCDGYFPCPYQNVCYAEKLVDIEGMGLYKKRSTVQVHKG